MLLFLFMPVSTKREFLGRPLIFSIVYIKHQQHGPCATASKQQCMQKIFIATVELPLENTE